MMMKFTISSYLINIYKRRGKKESKKAWQDILYYRKKQGSSWEDLANGKSIEFKDDDYSVEIIVNNVRLVICKDWCKEEV